MAKLQPQSAFQKRTHKPVSLDEAQRLAAVLRSQGICRRAEIASLPATVKAELAKLCNESGVFVEGARQKAEAILDAYYDSQKATVDRTPQKAPEAK